MAGSIKTGIFCLSAPLESIYLSIYLPTYKCVSLITRMLKQPRALSLSYFFSELLLLTSMPMPCCNRSELHKDEKRKMTATLMKPLSNPHHPHKHTLYTYLPILSLSLLHLCVFYFLCQGKGFRSSYWVVL